MALHEITPDKLMRLVGTPDCPQLIDVCIDADFADDPHLIPTATRYSHHDVARMPTGRDIIVICQKGQKLSHGVAAQLRARGCNAQILSGGNHAWRYAKLPRIPAHVLPGPLWVTRHRPKIDRIACPWLIRRFVDPHASFMFVPPAQVMDVADKFNATPFDMPDIPFGHQGGECSFDAMINTFNLHHPALDTLAQVIRAADTNRHDLAPQAAGLLAISVGLSRIYRDDNAQLDAGMLIYDALYRWARDGMNEGHDA